jgi:hypothetical protein
LNLVIYVAASAASTVALLYTGVETIAAVKMSAAIAGVLQFITLAIIYAGWRFIPGFTWFIFPNIDGLWSGKIVYERDSRAAEKKATINIAQNINAITLVLQTEDAESETIVVYPRRLQNSRFELLYVYETFRKPGRPPPFYRYRGTAVIRVEAGQLIGTYYTEQGGGGTLHFKRC